MTVERMNDTFWTNYDAIFGDVQSDHHYRCPDCGQLDRSDVLEKMDINYEPMGDRLVGRREIYLTCLLCGNDVDCLDY